MSCSFDGMKQSVKSKKFFYCKAFLWLKVWLYQMRQDSTFQYNWVEKKAVDGPLHFLVVNYDVAILTLRKVASSTVGSLLQYLNLDQGLTT